MFDITLAIIYPSPILQNNIEVISVACQRTKIVRLLFKLSWIRAKVLKPTIGKIFSHFFRNYRTDPPFFPSQVPTEVGMIRRSIGETPLYLR